MGRRKLLSLAELLNRTCSVLAMTPEDTELNAWLLPETVANGMVTGCRKHMRRLNSPHTIRTVLLGLAVGLSVLAPVLAVPGPSLRTGLWVTQKISEAAADPAAFEAAVRGNPHLSGVCLATGWKEIEKEPGKPDFSSIDKAVAVLRRIGMKYELGIKSGV